MRKLEWRAGVRTLMDIGSSDNPADRSVQQEVGIGVSSGITQTFPPMKHLQTPGRSFNSIIELLHEIYHGKCVSVDLFTGKMTLWVPNNEVHKLYCLVQLPTLQSLPLRRPIQLDLCQTCTYAGPCLGRGSASFLATRPHTSHDGEFYPWPPSSDRWGWSSLCSLAPMAWSPCLLFTDLPDIQCQYNVPHTLDTINYLNKRTNKLQLLTVDLVF